MVLIGVPSRTMASSPLPCGLLNNKRRHADAEPIEVADIVQPFEWRSVDTVQSADVVGDYLTGQRRSPDDVVHAPRAEAGMLQRFEQRKRSLYCSHIAVQRCVDEKGNRRAQTPTPIPRII